MIFLRVLAGEWLCLANIGQNLDIQIFLGGTAVE
jgi:hypothetical protein